MRTIIVNILHRDIAQEVMQARQMNRLRCARSPHTAPSLEDCPASEKGVRFALVTRLIRAKVPLHMDRMPAFLASEHDDLSRIVRGFKAFYRAAYPGRHIIEFEV